jgi:hypothetical protein
MRSPWERPVSQPASSCAGPETRTGALVSGPKMAGSLPGICT